MKTSRFYIPLNKKKRKFVFNWVNVTPVILNKAQQDKWLDPIMHFDANKGINTFPNWG